jgi:small subunit ribosomal protein S4
MINKPKYKIARRLGKGVFDKTQTQKFMLRGESKGKATETKHPRQRTDYGIQMLEKQKARVTYGVNERQFSNYVATAVAKKGTNSIDMLYASLESRLDNVVYRIGFAPTRQASRQMVSHGHILVNGKRVTIPSFKTSLEDVITIREGSKKSGLFITLTDRLKERAMPSWIKFNYEKNEAVIQGVPKAAPAEMLFDLASVVEFYSR